MTFNEEETGRIKRPRLEENWKLQVREELEAMNEAATVFVVINAWEPEGTDYILTEVLDMKYYETADRAWGRLLTIADAYGYNLAEDEVGFDLEPVQGISYQEYYIEELYRG